MPGQTPAQSGMAKVALVTGGAKRVGQAIVERLAAGGFHIAFTHLHTDPRDTEAAVIGAGRRVLAIQVDLAGPAGAQKVYDQFAAEFGRLDVLVNSASIYQPGDLRQATVEQARQMMAIHFEAPLLLCQKFEPMLRAARGHVVNMVDLLAERPWPQYVAYCASKAALANLTLSLARDLAPDVTVNGIAPGVVEWPDDYPQSEREKYLKRVPLGRSGTPQDVAELVHYFATAGDYVTGQIIRLDGGRSVT